MSSYVVLARKWRPAQFPDIVGQGHIVRTLSNSIRNQRIHQAYLFTGSRGIGKTSIARIFAKVIRCEQTQWDGTWLRSCDQCANCKEIATSTGVDVIEIDGASNNGVDAIRELRENAKFLPSSGSRKIYIIDEVHMLTTAAFNALLKTLEEPPPHIIFVFATTEPHKIPATILSRCQRFDFKRVTLAQIQSRLAKVTELEKIEAESASLALIARAAEGSMRDALSLLDQVIAFSGNKISVESVRESIGLIESQTLLGIIKAVFERNALSALTLLETAYNQGHDLRILSKSLIELIHGTVLAKLGAATSSTLEFSEEEWKELQQIASLRPLEEVELIFQVLHYGLDWIARSPQPKIVLDVLLVKCATAEVLTPVGEAMAATPQPSYNQSTAPKKQALASEKQASDKQTPPASSVTWEALISHVRKTRPLLASILENGSCTNLDLVHQNKTNELLIYYRPKDEYFTQQLKSKTYSDQLSSIFKEYFGRPVRTRLEFKDSVESPAALRQNETNEREQAAKNAAQNHPILLEAKALFGGEFGPIEIKEKNTEINHADV